MIKKMRLFKLVGCVLVLPLYLVGLAPREFSFSRNARSKNSITGNSNFKWIGVPTTITEPGIYVIQDHVVFDPTTDNQSCIVIDASDVLLDLNLKTVCQLPTNTQKGINGVEITASKKNVIIRGGSIRSMSGSAIIVRDDTEFLDFFDVTILDMGRAGIEFDGLSTGTGIASSIMANVAIGDIQSNDGGSVYGMYLRNTKVLDIENSGCSTNFTTTGDNYGFKFENCSSMRLKSCVAAEHQGSGSLCASFAFTDCRSSVLIDCAATQLKNFSSDTASACVGFLVETSTSITIESSSVACLQATFSTIGVQFSGCEDCVVQDSEILSAASLYGESIGFCSLGSIGSTFLRCQALGNKATVNGIGFASFGDVAAIIQECEAAFDYGQTGTGAGVYLINSGGCSVFGNKVIGHTGGTAGYGIYDNTGASTQNTILANFAKGNTVNFDPASPTIPIYAGGLSGTPGPFENISF